MAARKPFLLRIDPELWADLEAWAQDELRSVNGQIEYLLKQAVMKRKGGHETGTRVESGGETKATGGESA
jgi:hypothetical protein